GKDGWYIFVSPQMFMHLPRHRGMASVRSLPAILAATYPQTPRKLVRYSFVQYLPPQRCTPWSRAWTRHMPHISPRVSAVKGSCCDGHTIYSTLWPWKIDHFITAY